MKKLKKIEKNALLNIAKKYMAAVETRGDLEERGCDSEDFIEIPVWALEKALEEAYTFGKEISELK